ncbi:MAG: ASCH domain-containing protein [Nanoarchaeota archaeon]
MKKLRFAEPLPRLIQIGKKDTTWRINDEKNISCGDELSLCYGDGLNKEKEFARAKVLWIKETTFEELTEEDYKGHEKFVSEKEMYETYSRYYQIPVSPKTRVKVIKFKLINNL